MKHSVVFPFAAMLFAASCASPPAPAVTCQDDLKRLESAYEASVADMRESQRTSPSSERALAGPDKVAAAFDKLEEARSNCSGAL